jgi:hypothetical protein
MSVYLSLSTAQVNRQQATVGNNNRQQATAGNRPGNLTNLQSILEIAIMGHYLVIVTGSLHLVGGALSILEPENST